MGGSSSSTTVCTHNRSGPKSSSRATTKSSHGPWTFAVAFNNHAGLWRRHGWTEEPWQREVAPRGESGAIRAKPALQDQERGDVRYFWQVRSTQANSYRDCPEHKGDRVCSV